MFEQAIVRLDVADGRAEPVVAGPTVNYAPSLTADGKLRHCIFVPVD